MVGQKAAGNKTAPKATRVEHSEMSKTNQANLGDTENLEHNYWFVGSSEQSYIRTAVVQRASAAK